MSIIPEITMMRIEKALSKSFYDRMDVYCYTDSEKLNENGVYEQKKEMIYTDIPCRFGRNRNSASRTKLAFAVESQGFGQVDDRILIFAPKNTLIKAGYCCEIRTKDGKRYLGELSDAYYYSTHTEIHLKTFRFA